MICRLCIFCNENIVDYIVCRRHHWFTLCAQLGEVEFIERVVDSRPIVGSFSLQTVFERFTFTGYQAKVQSKREIDGQTEVLAAPCQNHIRSVTLSKVQNQSHYNCNELL